MNLLHYVWTILHKKNIAVIKKILGDEINIFFDVGAHKCETINLFNKHFKIKKIFAFEANVDLISNLKQFLTLLSFLKV